MQGRFKSVRARFLADCFGGEDDVDLLLRNHQQTRDDLFRWLRKPEFRRRFRQLLLANRYLRDLHLTRSSVAAARKLHAAMDAAMADFTEQQRKVCVDLIKLSEMRRPRPPRRSPVDARPSPIAPNVSDEEAAALIKSLSRDE